MSTALALREPQQTFSAPSHRAQIVLPGGAVRAGLNFVRFTRKGALFSLQVENEFDTPVLGCAFARSEGDPPITAALDSFWISADASVEYQLLVPRRMLLRFDHLSVRLRNNVTEYSVDCAVPRRAKRLVITGSLLAACAAAAVVGSTFFGHTQRVVNVVRLPAIKQTVVLRGASVASLALDQTVANAGQPLIVRYSVGGARGGVRAIDANGTVWSSAPLSPTGISTLQLPHFAHDKELRIDVTATKNGDRTDSSVGIYVRAQLPKVPSAARTGSSAINPIAVLTQRPVPGSDVVVLIRSHPRNLRVALTTDSGQTLQSRNIGNSESQIAMPVPANLSGNLVLVASFESGNSSQTLVQGLRLSSP